MPTWPASLPTYPLVRGYEETGQEGVIRSQMEQGPPKVRKRFTAVVIEFQAAFILDDTDTDTLMDFFEDDAGLGSVAFTWTHPRKDTVIETRFVKRPEMSPAGADGYWRLDCVFEVLP